MTVPAVLFSVGQDVHFLFESVVVLLAIGVTWFSYGMLQELREKGEKAMSSFQLHREEAVQEFEYLFGGSVMLVVGASFYLAGGIADNAWLVNVGLAAESVFIASMGFVLYRWWGRF